MFASARDPKKLKEVKATDIELIQLDVLSIESIEVAVPQVSQLTDGSLDSMVNNAGQGYCMPFTDLDVQKVAIYLS